METEPPPVRPPRDEMIFVFVLIWFFDFIYIYKKVGHNRRGGGDDGERSGIDPKAYPSNHHHSFCVG